MSKSPKLTALIATTLVFGCAGCSSEQSTASVEEAWNYNINSSYARANDLEFDIMTGEVLAAKSASGLSSKGADAPEKQTKEETIEDFCASYIRDADEDDRRTEKFQLERVVMDRYSISLFRARENLSDEFRNASSQISDQVDKEIPELERSEKLYFQTDYNRQQLSEKLWDEHCSNPTNESVCQERVAWVDLLAKTDEEVNGDAGLKQMQDLIIEKCDFEVGDSFMYLTEADLED